MSDVIEETPDGCADERSAEFLDRLRSEVLHHKEKRAAFTLQKLAFITALFGVAALQLSPSGGRPSITFDWILYLVPFIAISYDVYIYAEDYKVKRAGSFIRTHKSAQSCASDCEQAWERYVEEGRREPLATVATLILTWLTTVAAFLVLQSISGKIGYGLWLLVGLGLVIPLVLFGYYRYSLRRRLQVTVLG
jgi:hypothetical protein